MALDSFIFGGNTGATPEDLARRRKLAEAMMARGSDTSPIRHWTQGAARVADAALGAWEDRQLRNEEKAGREGADKRFMEAIGLAPASASSPAASSPSQANPLANVKPMGDDLDKAANAITSIESGGRYDALGPVTKSGDRAYGRYQVMGANVPAWTRQYLGREMTPQEFAASPEAQDAVFRGEFGRLSQKHGPEGAARAWFAGEGGMNDPNRKDILGTSVADYSRKFTTAFAPGGSAPQQVAQSGGAPATAQPPAASQGGVTGLSPRAAQLMGVMNDQWASPAAKQVAGALLQREMTPQTYTYQTQPDGTILRMDPRGGAPVPVYQGQNKAQYGVIGRDDFGNEQYGWIDPVTRQVTPAQPGQGAAQQAPAAASPQRGPSGRPVVQGPDGPVEIPEGVDPKIFRQKMSEAAAQRATGEGATPLTAEERQQISIPEGQPAYKTRTGEIKFGPAGTKIVNEAQKQETEFGKETGKALAKRFDTLATDGDDAIKDQQLLAELRQLGARIDTGIGARAKAYLGRIGIKTDGVSDIEAFETLINRLTPQQRVPGSGATSDFDAKMFKESLPNLTNTPEGNALVIDTLDMLAKNRIARGDVAMRVQVGEITPKEGLMEIRRLQMEAKAASDAIAERAKAEKANPETTKPPPGPQAQPQAPAMPKPGTIDQGYRFKGGNPADPNSWEKVQ